MLLKQNQKKKEENVKLLEQNEIKLCYKFGINV